MRERIIQMWAGYHIYDAPTVRLGRTLSVRFGSEADISQGWPENRALGSAYGQEQTLAMQKETRPKPGSTIDLESNKDYLATPITFISNLSPTPYRASAMGLSVKLIT
jgi:hypothetical protein